MTSLCSEASAETFATFEMGEDENIIKSVEVEEKLVKHRADILRTLCYPDVAAHLLSRGVISMPEHRKIFAQSDEVARVDKLLEILSTRENSVKHLVDGMRDLTLLGKYTRLAKLLET